MLNMKFTNGYWMNREGVENSDVGQIREVKIEDNRVYLYCVPYHSDSRAIGGPVIEMFVSSPQPDIIRIQAYHFMGSNQKELAYELNFSEVKLEVAESEKKVEIKSGCTRLVINKNYCSFTYYYKDRKLTNVGDRYGYAMISTLKTPDGPFMRCQLDLCPGEKVYGLGERFTPFVKNGQSIELWNEDGGASTDIAYKNIPFYITNNSYGVFVNSTDAVSYEVCSEVASRVQFSVPGEKLDYMVIGGEDMKGVLESYTTLTGKPALPPAWSFGLWLTSSFHTSYDEKTVTDFVNGMRERRIPLSVFHFDCFWMRENEWCGFEWDKAVFGDVDGMLRRMKQNGDLKICVWINPYIGQKSPAFKEAKELGYLLKKPNSDVWQWDLWQAGQGIVDFTNPDACEWYKGKLRKLLDNGVDCFKTDFGERIPTDVVYFDGSEPAKMHNYYSYLYNKCVFDLLEEYRGANEACLFARSATACCQRFPVHWGGDCHSNYVSMYETLRGGLSLCLSGFSFWSHDISGFEGTASNDVYKRWAAFGLLSTHSRLHGSGSYRVPWLFGDEAVDVVRFFTEFKCSLMPYLFSNAVYSHTTGVPTMRAMVLEFPKDRVCADLDCQYMLGDSLLVAPVFTESGDVDYYLPSGTWTHMFSNKTVEGGSWISENHDFFSLPLMVRENSIIALGSNNQTPEYDYSDGLSLHIFELKGSAYTEVCNTDGSRFLTVRAVNENGRVTITLEGAATRLSVIMRNVTDVKDLKGASKRAETVGTVLEVFDNTVSFTV